MQVQVSCLKLGQEIRDRKQAEEEVRRKGSRGARARTPARQAPTVSR